MIKKILAVCAAVFFLMIINNDQAAAFSWSEAKSPLPSCPIDFGEGLITAIERDLSGIADFENKNHSWSIFMIKAGTEENSRIVVEYSIDKRWEARNYNLYLYPMNNNQHYLQYMTVALANPSKVSPYTFQYSGEITCMIMTRNITYWADYKGGKLPDYDEYLAAQEPATPPSDGGGSGSGSGGITADQLKTVLTEFIKPSYEIMGSLAAVVAVGGAVYLFYRSLKFMYIRWLH